MHDWQTTDGQRWAANADHYSRMLAGFGARLVDAAAFRPGELVLDVGCGCGDVSIAAAEAVGATGRVTGVDLSPDMLAVARDRAARAGVANVDFVVADATALQPGPTSFDVAVSRFGVMFFDDPTAAFTNIRSLVRPGGRLAFVCWQDPVSNGWAGVPHGAVAELLSLRPSDDPNAPGPFAFADGDRVASILRAAGFADPRVTGVTGRVWVGQTAAAAAAIWRTTSAGREALDGADPALERQALGAVESALTPYESESGVEVDGAAWIVTASV